METEDGDCKRKGSFERDHKEHDAVKKGEKGTERAVLKREKRPHRCVFCGELSISAITTRLRVEGERPGRGDIAAVFKICK